MTLQILKCLPRKILSHYFGILMHFRLPGVLGSLSVRAFAACFKIDMAEAEKPLHEYKTIGELFIRRLKAGLRPLAESPAVHPCDGVLTTSGMIQERQLLQAKGMTYDLCEFVNDDLAYEKWQQGFYLTYYLCPTDYHRVHSPVSGQIISVDLIPGDLWPVNRLSTSKVPSLFARNERVVVTLQAERGLVAVIFIGATNVGKITLSFDQAVSSRSFQQRKELVHLQYEVPISINQGQELGIFHMGSTVVVLYSSDFVSQLHFKTALQGPVRMGNW